MRADPYSVAIEIDDSYVAEVDSAAIESLVSHVLRGEGVAPPAEVSIWITDESEVQRLNRSVQRRLIRCCFRSNSMDNSVGPSGEVQLGGEGLKSLRRLLRAVTALNGTRLIDGHTSIINRKLAIGPIVDTVKLIRHAHVSSAAFKTD